MQIQVGDGGWKNNYSFPHHPYRESIFFNSINNPIALILQHTKCSNAVRWRWKLPNRLDVRQNYLLVHHSELLTALCSSLQDVFSKVALTHTHTLNIPLALLAAVLWHHLWRPPRPIGSLRLLCCSSHVLFFFFFFLFFLFPPQTFHNS